MLMLKKKKLYRKFYLKVGYCGQKYSNYGYCLVFVMTNLLQCLHKPHIIISSEMFLD